MPNPARPPRLLVLRPYLRRLLRQRAAHVKRTAEAAAT